MTRVVGTDPGTSSLDVVVLEDGVVVAERRWQPPELAAGADEVVSFLRAQAPLDLVAAPSGYGLPLARLDALSERDLGLIALVRPDDRHRVRGVVGLTKVIHALAASGLPAVVLPGGIHLPTIPRRRKRNRIDMGTPDKICVAALALEWLAGRGPKRLDFAALDFILVEVGSAFSAVLAIQGGKIVDAACGTAGPVGLGSSGVMDGEVAYLLSPLSKDDLFTGGAGPLPREEERAELREAVVKAAAALRSVAPCPLTVLSGRALAQAELASELQSDFARSGEVVLLEPLPGARLKLAAQGAALLADGLAGGRFRPLVEHLELPRAAGSALDYLRYPGKRLRFVGGA